jgi:hypothetical protein
MTGAPGSLPAKAEPIDPLQEFLHGSRGGEGWRKWLVALPRRVWTRKKRVFAPIPRHFGRVPCRLGKFSPAESWQEKCNMRKLRPQASMNGTVGRRMHFTPDQR